MKKLTLLIICLIVISSINLMCIKPSKKKVSPKAVPEEIKPLVAYRLDSLWYFMGNDGKLLFPPKKLKAIRGYSEGFFPVTFDYNGKTRWAYLTMKGDLNMMEADELRLFKNGMGMFVIFENGNDSLLKFGFINSEGKEITPPIWKDATDFTEGLAWVMNDSIRGYINKSGKFEFQFMEKGFGNNFFEGVAGYHNEAGDFGYMDKTGKKIIPCKFDEVGNFVEGLANVFTEGKFGYINKSGEYVIPPSYDFAFDFVDGFTFVGNAIDSTYKAKWAIINKSGKKVVDFNYDFIRNFSEGIAAVSTGNVWYFVDQFGSKIMDKTFKYADSFKDGLAWVVDEKSGKRGFINQLGEWVIEIPEASLTVDLRFNRVLK